MVKYTKAWAAGLFEGEGTIVKRANKTPAWTASISSTDEDVLQVFYNVVGVGKVYGPYGYSNDSNRRRDHHKQYWRWSVSDKAGFLQFAQKLGPYLLSRRRARLKEARVDMVKLVPKPRRKR